MVTDEHDCLYRARHDDAEAAEARVADLEQQLAQSEVKLALVSAANAKLNKQIYGKQSERMPSVSDVLAKESRGKNGPVDDAAKREKTQAVRKANAEARSAAAVEEHEHAYVDHEARVCPCCSGEAKTISSKKSTTTYIYVNGYFKTRVVYRETVACSCGDYIHSAAPPAKVLGQSKYSSTFIAFLIVAKVLDAIPVYRLEKRFKRTGIPMARSSMNDLVNKTGHALRILVQRLFEIIAEQQVVLADETTLPVKATGKTKRGFIWTFIAKVLVGDEDDEDAERTLVAYRFSKTRSGETPVKILGESSGVLVVDAYSGYNNVSGSTGRERAACLAHVRRKFFDAGGEPAQKALALILDVYRVEHDASERGIVRTEEHAELRRTKSRAAMNAFRQWLKDNAGKHGPKSGLGNAIRHALGNWDRLIVFVDNVDVPVDNNESERALRPIAKGRDNWLYAGNDEAAHNIATLLSLAACCEANGINPEQYLADVLERIETHPQSRLDELLPHLWRPLASG